MSEQSLLATNSLSSTDKIFAGQTLRVPGSTDRECRPGSGESPPGPGPSSCRLPPWSRPATSPFEGRCREELEAALTPAALADGNPSAGQRGQGETEDTTENALASTQPELAADPSDYSVSAANDITVQALETLGHYADWLSLPTQKLRDLNHIKAREAVVIGQTSSTSQVDAATFEQRRRSYQQQRQDEFFAAYQIEDVASHVIKPGESLWVLAERTYKVPVWLPASTTPT
jgi:membrane-bound lytic murein transglycosylase D